MHRGRQVRSRVDGAVMAVERRDLVIQLRPFMVASMLEIKEYNSTMTTRAKIVSKLSDICGASNV